MGQHPVTGYSRIVEFGFPSFSGVSVVVTAPMKDAGTETKEIERERE